MLDLRNAHHDFAITQARPTTVNTAEDVRMFRSYSAILRDGRIRLYAKAESGRDVGAWIEMKEMTVESARRLRDTLSAFLDDDSRSALPRSWRDL